MIIQASLVIRRKPLYYLGESHELKLLLVGYFSLRAQDLIYNAHLTHWWKQRNLSSPRGSVFVLFFYWGEVTLGRSTIHTNGSFLCFWPGLPPVKMIGREYSAETRMGQKTREFPFVFIVDLQRVIHPPNKKVNLRSESDHSDVDHHDRRHHGILHASEHGWW